MDDRLCHLVNLAVNSTTATMENRDSVLGYILLLIILIMLNALASES